VKLEKMPPLQLNYLSAVTGHNSTACYVEHESDFPILPIYMTQAFLLPSFFCPGLPLTLVFFSAWIILRQEITSEIRPIQKLGFTVPKTSSQPAW
jgi:hypothetical protein